MKEFTSPTSREDRVIEFMVDGETYHFTPGKKVGLFASTNMTRDFLNWLGEGLPEEEAERLNARLQDPNDTFDLDQVGEIARYLMGQVAGRPTKRR